MRMFEDVAGHLLKDDKQDNKTPFNDLVFMT